MTETKELLQEVEGLLKELQNVESLLQDINSKVDYLIEMQGIGNDIEKHNALDWTGGSQ